MFAQPSMRFMLDNNEETQIGLEVLIRQNNMMVVCNFMDKKDEDGKAKAI